MKSRIEQGAFAVLGAADLIAEKAAVVAGVHPLREGSVLDQLRELEPKLRRGLDDVTQRGEQVADRLRVRVADARRGVGSVPAEARRTLDALQADARKAVDGLREEASGQLQQLRGRVTQRVDQLLSRSARAAGSDESVEAA